MSDLQALIEAAFERRAEITPRSVDARTREAIHEAIALLDSGQARVAERRGVGDWMVNEWLKKAVLLSFRINDNEIMRAGFTHFYDKVPSRFGDMNSAELAASGVRVVPPAFARKGSYIASGTVLMPSYVNIGAYVDTGTMVDTW
ncbi:MAG: 2,3,4,5-tetrahydropyridine-2,6-dicarboxylate N-succinyltransferase, partial [Thiothrix sp.]|nr:2,3,4,5-tetrahydropyridine-2,6-dicarboxylate N-succinyltransferase [Thiothrix sp.]